MFLPFSFTLSLLYVSSLFSFSSISCSFFQLHLLTVLFLSLFIVHFLCPSVLRLYIPPFPFLFSFLFFFPPFFSPSPFSLSRYLVWEQYAPFSNWLCPGQWRNMGVGERDFWPWNFCWPTVKREARKKRENAEKSRKERKSKKRRWEIANGRRISLKMRRELFFSLFKTTKICFGSNKMGVSTGKRHFTPGKIRKNDFALSENIPLAPLPLLFKNTKMLQFSPKTHQKQFLQVYFYD